MANWIVNLPGINLSSPAVSISLSVSLSVSVSFWGLLCDNSECYRGPQTKSDLTPKKPAQTFRIKFNYDCATAANINFSALLPRI